MNRRTLARAAAVAVGITALPLTALAADSYHQSTRHHGPTDGGYDYVDAAVVDGGDLGPLGAEVEAIFWGTPFVTCDGHANPADLSGPATCDDTAFTWTFSLDAPSPRLRVDFDYPYRQDDHVLTVTRPDGEEVSLLVDARARCNRLSDPYVWLDAYILDAQCALGLKWNHPDTLRWIATMRELASRTTMKELTVRSLLHGAALGDSDDASAAALLAAVIDNPMLDLLLARR